MDNEYNRKRSTNHSSRMKNNVQIIVFNLDENWALLNWNTWVLLNWNLQHNSKYELYDMEQIL